MKPNDRDAIKVERQVLWKSKSGKFVVVEGPFPHGFIRCETRRTVDQASRTSAESEMFTRGGTHKAGWYAKTLARYVVVPNNEWGEICP